MDAAVNAFVSRKVISAVGKTVRMEGSVISDTSRLADDLDLGRFGRLKLGIYLEEIFDLELSDDVLAGFATVADIVRYISRRYFRNMDASVAALA